MNEIIKKEYIHLHCPATSKDELMQMASRWAVEAGIVEDSDFFP